MFSFLFYSYLLSLFCIFRKGNTSPDIISLDNKCIAIPKRVFFQLSMCYTMILCYLIK